MRGYFWGGGVVLTPCNQKIVIDPFQQQSMKSYCSENNAILLQNSDAYKAALFPSVELIKFLIIHVFKDFARICTNHTGTVES